MKGSNNLFDIQDPNPKPAHFGLDSFQVVGFVQLITPAVVLTLNLLKQHKKWLKIAPPRIHPATSPLTLIEAF